MATFTMTLNEVMEEDGNIGLSDYLIFNEEYRETLNRNIYEHFYNREIGFETAEYFRLRVGNHMRVNMPFFNKLYESLEIPFDPISTIYITTESESDSTEDARTDVEGNTTSSVGSKSKTVNHAFPQTALAGNEDYATAAVSANSDTSSLGSSVEGTSASREASDSNKSRTHGYQGSAADLIIKYRDSLINVDAAVIASLEPFFMSIWDIADNYTGSGFYYGSYNSAY